MPAYGIQLLIIIYCFSFIIVTECRIQNSKSPSTSENNIGERSSYRPDDVTDNSINFNQNIWESNKGSSMKNFVQYLSFISMPRSIKSNGHRKVRKFIETSLYQLSPNWFVEEDSFWANTTRGRIKFRNIVGTYLPSRQFCLPPFSFSSSSSMFTERQNVKRIVLACHYDSLRSPSPPHGSSFSSKFIGASDAAASCAMLLTIAEFMTPKLNQLWNDSPEFIRLKNRKRKKKRKMQPPALTLQLVFFDGEEALETISEQQSKKTTSRSSDSMSSLFGSNHLAKKWEQISLHFDNSNNNIQHNTMKKEISGNMILTKNEKRIFRHLQNLCNKDIPPHTWLAENQNSNVIAVPDEINKEEDKYDNINRRGRLLSQSQPLENVSNELTQKINNTDLLHFRQNYHSINNIKLMILLDLIGGANPRFFNTNPQTGSAFRRLAAIEKNILQNLKLSSSASGRIYSKPYFKVNPPFLISLVRDDHLPFVLRNVSVLHLIPSPFPRTWHRMTDTIENLDFISIQRILVVLQIFLSEIFTGRI